VALANKYYTANVQVSCLTMTWGVRTRVALNVLSHVFSYEPMAPRLSSISALRGKKSHEERPAIISAPRSYGSRRLTEEMDTLTKCDWQRQTAACQQISKVGQAKALAH
jgi:hypothetical protein